MEQKD